MAQQPKEWVIKLDGENIFATNKNDKNRTKSLNQAEKFFSKEDAEFTIKHRKIHSDYRAVHISEIQE